MKGRQSGKRKKKYRVGRGKPPRATQFSKGVSGNPRGRPKGSKNLGKILTAELGKSVTVMENGTRRKVNKGTATVMRLVQKAMEGDPRSMSALLSAIERSSTSEEPEEVPPTRFELDLLRKYFSYLEELLAHDDNSERAQAA